MPRNYLARIFFPIDEGDDMSNKIPDDVCGICYNNIDEADSCNRPDCPERIGKTIERKPKRATEEQLEDDLQNDRVR